MSLCELAITVERERRGETATIAGALREVGIEVSRVIPQIGAIYGRGEPTCMSAAEAVSGVAGVRRAPGVQLAPLDPSRPQ